MHRRIAVPLACVGLAAALTFGRPAAAHAEGPVQADLPGNFLLAQAPTPPLPAEPGLLERSEAAARDVAEGTRKAAQTFQDVLAGKAVEVGITQPVVRLNLQSRNQAKYTSTVETYKGTDDLHYMVALTSPSKQSEVLELTETLSAFGTANFAWNYGTFSLQQSLQESAAGGAAKGTANGDYMYFGFQVNARMIWANSFTPTAFGFHYVVGKGFARYQARLDYTVSGREYRVDVQNDGINPRQMMFGGFDINVGQFFYRVESMQIYGESYATFRGKRVFVYYHELDMRLQTLGYAFRF